MSFRGAEGMREKNSVSTLAVVPARKERTDKRIADLWVAELRIHDDIERGNNDTIKAASNSLADTTAGGGCCGSPAPPAGGR